MELCLAFPAAASSYDYTNYCLHDGCYLTLFFWEQWKCLTCVTPTPCTGLFPACSCAVSHSCSPAGYSTPVYLRPRDVRAVNCCPGYICTVYLFSDANIHEVIPSLMEAADKYPFASLQELNRWFSSSDGPSIRRLICPHRVMNTRQHPQPSKNIP